MTLLDPMWVEEILNTYSQVVYRGLPFRAYPSMKLRFAAIQHLNYLIENGIEVLDLVVHSSGDESCLWIVHMSDGSLYKTVLQESEIQITASTSVILDDFGLRSDILTIHRASSEHLFLVTYYPSGGNKSMKFKPNRYDSFRKRKSVPKPELGDITLKMREKFEDEQLD